MDGPLAQWTSELFTGRRCIPEIVNRMRIKIFEVSFLILILAGQTVAQSRAGIPQPLPHLKRDRTQRVLYPKIIQHEDERIVDDELIEMLSFPHAGVKRRVILALGRIGYPLGINPLVDVLNTSRDPEMRSVAAFSLGQIGSSYAVTALLGKLENADEAPIVRARAAEALGKIASNKSSAESLGNFGVKAIG